MTHEEILNDILASICATELRNEEHNGKIQEVRVFHLHGCCQSFRIKAILKNPEALSPHSEEKFRYEILEYTAEKT